MTISILNPTLVKKQELTTEDQMELVRLHELKERMFEQMMLLNPEDLNDNITLRVFADLLESLEYNMQRVWKFDQDSQFHSWWYKVPHCKCPRMDNADPIYLHRIVNGNCPIHGRK